nr:uncharacterized protein LOC133578220 isoform X1 [Nerophis lumbriciformis]
MPTLAPEATLLAWSFLVASLWTSGSAQVLQDSNSKRVYPQLLSAQAIDCDCTNMSCNAAQWFRTLFSSNQVQYLGRINSAERIFHGDDVDPEKFKFSRKRSDEAFTLHVVNVTQDDAGTYSCVSTNKRKQEMWQAGVLLLPGVTPPTFPPDSTPLTPDCSCTLQDVCDSLILWSLAGLTSVLMLTLVFTLYYFSRLPRKCRHHFVKDKHQSEDCAEVF